MIVDVSTMDIEPFVFNILNWIIFVHLMIVGAYFVLLGRDLIRGTDSAYPYKETEALAKKKK